MQLLPWLLIASSPVIFAIATWDPLTTHNPVQAWMRTYGVPVILVELLVVGLALANGFEPLKTLVRAPLWVRIALAALLLIGLATALLVAPDRQTALTRTLFSVTHLLFGLAVAYLAAGSSPLISRLIWPSIVAGLCGYLLILILYVAILPSPTTFDWAHFRLAVVNIRQVGFYSAAGGAAALGVALARKELSWFALSLIAASGLLAMSFWSGTRGSLVAVGAAFVVGALLLKPLRTIRAWLALGCATAFGALLSLVHSVPYFLYGTSRLAATTSLRSLEDVSSGRWSTWLGTIRVIRERPLFGYGESQFRGIVPEALGSYNHPHNIVLQIVLQWGLIGAACFFALAVFLAVRCVRALRLAPTMNLPAFLVLASLLTMSLYEGTLYHSYPIMMVAVCIGCILVNQSSPNGDKA